MIINTANQLRACDEKVKHTEQSAIAKAKYLSNVKTKPIRSLRAYKCDYCDGYHLTSKPEVTT